MAFWERRTRGSAHGPTRPRNGGRGGRSPDDYDGTVILRRLTRALLAALLIAVGITSAPSPARADGDHLDVRITSVSTPVLDLSDAGKVIELKGTLTNTSTTTVTKAVVHFWRLPTPIRTAEQLRTLSADPPIGSRVTESSTLAEIEQIGPGEHADFTVRASIAQLTTEDDPLTSADAAYLIGAQVRGSLAGNAARSTLGEAVFPVTATRSRVESAAIVRLTATPSWLPDGTFTNTDLTAELGGRLDTLLSSAERPDVRTAVDPALYEAVTRLSETNGVALRWVQRVDALATAGRLWRLPYGDPDLARASASGALDDVLSWSAKAGATSLTDLPSVAILDQADDDLLTRLHDFDTIVVRGATGSRPGDPAVLGAVTETGTPAGSGGTDLAARIAGEFLSPDLPLHVIDTAEAAAADDLGQWRQHTIPTAGADDTLTLPAGTTQPWPGVVAALHDAARNASLIGDLTASDPEDLSPLGANAWSAGFSDEADALAYIAAAAPVTIDLDKVTLRAAGSFVMGSRTNTFPATLTNGLSVPITVGVRFHSDSPQRIRVPDIEPVTIAPGESFAIDVTPEASANGVSLVRARAVTSDGVEVGKTVTIEITATDFGRVGWIIILVSGAVVLGGTAWRIRAVRRERARTSAKEDSEPGQ